MTLSPFLVYLAMQLDDIKSTMVLVLFICIVGFIVSGIALSDRYTEEERKGPRRLQRFCITGLLISVLCMAFLPSSKTVAAMIILPAISESEQVKGLPDDVIAFLRGIIREYTPQKETDL